MSCSDQEQEERNWNLSATEAYRLEGGLEEIVRHDVPAQVQKGVQDVGLLPQSVA